MKYREFDEVMIGEYKENSKFADEDLKFTIEEFKKDGDEKILLVTIRRVAIAKGGFTQLAKKTGLTRASLYKTLSKSGNPRFSSMLKIMDALDYKISFQHI
jgi:probable addiction module antidote protein